MPEPTKEELLARIAELEIRTEAKKSGKLEFKVGGKRPKTPPPMEGIRR